MKENTTLFTVSNQNQKWIFNTKGQHSVNTEKKVWFLFSVKMLVQSSSIFSANFLMMLYICTTFCENISTFLKVNERTLFPN